MEGPLQLGNPPLVLVRPALDALRSQTSSSAVTPTFWGPGHLLVSMASCSIASCILCRSDLAWATLALSLKLIYAGMAMAARIPIIATFTISSINVKPPLYLGLIILPAFLVLLKVPFTRKFDEFTRAQGPKGVNDFRIFIALIPGTHWPRITDQLADEGEMRSWRKAGGKVQAKTDDRPGRR